MDNDRELLVLRRRGAKLPPRLARQRSAREFAERSNRVAGGGRIGGVSLDQDLWLVAPIDASAEIARNNDEERDLPALDQTLASAPVFRRATER